MQRFQLEATYLTLTSNVVAAAVQEASLRGQIEATSETVRIEAHLTDILRQQFALGQATRGDVAAQEAALAQAQQALPPLGVQGHPRAPLSFHVAEQIAGSPLAHGTRSALKFNSFWTIELEPGWSLLAMHPFNREDLPFRVVTGLVDADRFNAVGINFPAVWLDPGFSGVLPRGMPVVQCCAVPRAAPELVCEPMSAQRVAGYEALAGRIMAGPGVYRKTYRGKRG